MLMEMRSSSLTVELRWQTKMQRPCALVVGISWTAWPRLKHKPSSVNCGSERNQLWVTESSQGERPSWAVMRCCILKHTVNEIKRANKLKQRKKLIGLVLFILLVSCQNTERDPKWQHFSGVDMINTRVWDPKRPSTCGDFLITTFDQWDLGAKLIFQALNGSSIPMSTSITSFFFVWMRNMWLEPRTACVSWTFRKICVSICVLGQELLLFWLLCPPQASSYARRCMQKKWVMYGDVLPAAFWFYLHNSAFMHCMANIPLVYRERHFNSDDSEPVWNRQSCFIRRFSRVSRGGHTIGQSWVPQEWDCQGIILCGK